MSSIRKEIPKASIKFLGTRGLLLLAQIQPTVLKTLQSDSKVVESAKNMPMFAKNAIIQDWSLSADQAKLWHVSLLGVECLVLVLFNLVMWGGDCCRPRDAKVVEAREENDHNTPLLMA